MKEKGKVFMTNTRQHKYTWENVQPRHILVHIFSGELALSYGKTSLTFISGDTVLIPRNKLFRTVKSPVNGEPFKCVSIILPDQHLRKFYLDRSVMEIEEESKSSYKVIKPHPLLASLFGSLLPYFDMLEELPTELIAIKIQEALTVIDTVDKLASAILGTFEQPGKIDLEKYMEEHFMHNLQLDKFAFLTGRSLTTFKRDFKNVFQSTPGKWLTIKRLGLAHHKLLIERKKINDVYMSVGFENISHFSFAFKKRFGYTPSEIPLNR
ncbi:AraC family transcriptional regulator [Pedobacter antarcticus]|uniref:helix-turn-helix domain-containing protein n=1 Tax=Pedobacter antarcticus TaxID=34086 RepID=UPI00292F91D4|nr:AraC family transcriptional regulator [Pedobacter antarcticus]